MIRIFLGIYYYTYYYNFIYFLQRYLFIQFDGGAENTAKEFYAFCEYLVRESIFDKVEVSRLPVGHTHEDIDAMFGVLWKAAQGKTIITPQQWEEIAKGAFKIE
jgi:hypothetical protein